MKYSKKRRIYLQFGLIFRSKDQMLFASYYAAYKQLTWLYSVMSIFGHEISCIY